MKSPSPGSGVDPGPAERDPLGRCTPTARSRLDHPKRPVVPVERTIIDRSRDRHRKALHLLVVPHRIADTQRADVLKYTIWAGARAISTTVSNRLKSGVVAKRSVRAELDRPRRQHIQNHRRSRHRAPVGDSHRCSSSDRGICCRWVTMAVTAPRSDPECPQHERRSVFTLMSPG